MKKEILKHNDIQFLTDFKSVRAILVISNGCFFHVMKHEVLSAAKQGKINYYLTDKIFVRKRTVMVLC